MADETIETPESSNVKRYGYRDADGVLTVTFKDRDGDETDTWEYEAPRSEFDKAKKAPSIGKFLRASVIGKFPAKEV